MTKTNTQKKTRTSPYQTRSKTRATTGMVYDGEWKNGKMHGKGVFTYSDEDTYDGEWKYGVEHGKGVRTYSDGDTYDGEWKYGMMHGVGRLTLSDGRTYYGMMPGILFDV